MIVTMFNWLWKIVENKRSFNCVKKTCSYEWKTYELGESITRYGEPWCWSFVTRQNWWSQARCASSTITCTENGRDWTLQYTNTSCSWICYCVVRCSDCHSSDSSTFVYWNDNTLFCWLKWTSYDVTKYLQDGKFFCWDPKTWILNENKIIFVEHQYSSSSRCDQWISKYR